MVDMIFLPAVLSMTNVGNKVIFPIFQGILKYQNEQQAQAFSLYILYHFSKTARKLTLDRAFQSFILVIRLLQMHSTIA